LSVENNANTRCVEEAKQVNFLQGTTKQSVKSLEGIIEIVTVGGGTVANIPYPYIEVSTTGLPNPSTWSIYKNEYINIVGVNGLTLDFADITTTWARQKVVGGGAMPNGSGWTLIGTDWVRPAKSVIDEAKSTLGFVAGSGGNDSFVKAYKISGVGNNLKPINYSGGITLGALFAKLLNSGTCNYTIVSDFFGINPDNTHPNNNAYASASQYFQNVLIFKAADIKRPESLNPSTIMMLSIEELRNEMKVLFNVSFNVYSIGAVNYFRIEHESYYDVSTAVGIDATTGNAISLNEYQYLSDKLPRQEKFLFNSFTDGIGGTFDGYPIDYSETCSDNSTIEHRAVLTMTNITQLYDNESFSDTGIVFICTYFDSNGARFILGENLGNDYMGFPKLQDFFYYYGRPFTNGTINAVSKVFVMGRTKVEDVEISKYDSCDAHVLDTTKLAKTFIGNGQIVNAKYDALNCKLSLTLHH
jgi:hypothetical protein